MPSRARRTAASAPKTASKGQGLLEAPAQPTRDPPQLPPTALQGTATESKQSTGSRLRKRRLAETTFSDEGLPVAKRSLPKRTAQATGKPSPVETSIQTSTNAATQAIVGSDIDGVNESDKVTYDAFVPETQFESQETSTVIADPSQDQDTSGGIGIEDAIDHGGMVDSQHVPHIYDAMGVVEHGVLDHLGATYTLKIQSLPVLDNLAGQILKMMARSSYHEILAIATKIDTDPGQAYANLKSLFDHTKKIYSLQEPFLNPKELKLRERSEMETIRKTNMATFISSVFGSQDVGFYHLNENFLDTFVADGGRLLKNQAQIYLDLKTQAYISAVQNTDRSREDILDDLFPADLDKRLLKRRPGAKSLAPSENEFVQRARNRRKALSDESTSEETLGQLAGKYIWEDFLRDVSSYVSKSSETFSNELSRKPPAIRNAPNGTAPNLSLHTLEDQHNQPGLPPQTPQPNGQSQPTIKPNIQNDIAAKAAQAANYAMQGFSNNQETPLSQPPQHSTRTPNPPPPHSSSQQPQLATPEIQYHFEHPLHPNVPTPPQPYFHPSPYPQTHWSGAYLNPSLDPDQPLIPYPTQSAPTQVLYERARHALTAKSSSPNTPRNNSTARSGAPSQRRPWTTEEETALMAGLDRVKGPHWSQILAMFGPGGTINEILKDRNQVQLKDKARNLKLFFLKSGIEVPYYLQFVTGELKTRAPGRARREEERLRNGASGTQVEEDRAHVEGLMALAGGRGGGANTSNGVPQQTNNPVVNGTGELRPAAPVANMGGGGLQQTNGTSSDIEVPIDPEMMAAEQQQQQQQQGNPISPASAPATTTVDIQTNGTGEEEGMAIELDAAIVTSNG